MRTLSPVKSLFQRLNCSKLNVIFALGLGFSLAACGGTATHSNVPGAVPSLTSGSLQASPKIAIPKPVDMTASVQVNGRVSRLVEMDIVKTGQQIPLTYSEGKINNSPAYEWWVSKHFAIKSDLPENKVKLYLELLEMSYPHYVELFGAEPANIDRQRIAVVYGKSRVSTRSTMLDDGFRRGVHKNAGGETMYYNRAGYSFPSSREQHQRYLVIHETMHAFHMALSGHSSWAPNWITEGLADSIASHVYYPQRKQLAVMVRDRAPMNYLQSGLKQFYEGGEPNIAAINDDPALKRGLNFFIIHFLLSQTERTQYFSWFRDQLMAANPHSKDTLPTANKMLKEIFPNWQELEAAFQQYVEGAKPSFYIAYGPWEQDGNSYWIRSQEEEHQPRLDIHLSPASQTIDKHLFDFPAPLHSPLITRTEQPDTTALGLLINFRAGQFARGEVGLGLGLTIASENETFHQTFQGEIDNNKDSFFSLLLKEGRYLVWDGPNYQAFALNEALLKSLEIQNQSGSAELGVNLQLLGQQLIVDLLSHDATMPSTSATPITQQRFTIEIDNASHDLIANSPVSLLASGASHQLTPYLQAIQSSQPSTPNMTNSSAANPWEFTEMALLQRVFRACLFSQAVICNDKSNPQGLSSVYPLLEDKSKHQQALQKLQALEQSLFEAGGDKILLELSGIKLELGHDRRKTVLRAENPSMQNASINVALIQESKTISSKVLDVLGTETFELPLLAKLQHNFGATPLSINASVNWRGKTFSLRQTLKQPGFDGVYLTDNSRLEEKTVINQLRLSGPYSGETSGTLRIEIMPSKAAKDSVHERTINIAPYEHLDFEHRFIRNPNYQGDIVIHSSATLEVDGEAVYISKQQRLKVTALK